MNKQLDRRLKRLEQRKSLQVKKQWVPQWLSDLWQEEYGLPFDTLEKAHDSLRRIQELDTTVRSTDDDGANH